MSLALEREMRQLEGERKMTEVAVASEQQRMSRLLKGKMGEEIKESFKEPTRMSRFKEKIMSFLSLF